VNQGSRHVAETLPTRIPYAKPISAGCRAAHRIDWWLNWADNLTVATVHVDETRFSNVLGRLLRARRRRCYNFTG
jgi:hypothetical protein